jgi:hypothetical protein
VLCDGDGDGAVTRRSASELVLRGGDKADRVNGLALALALALAFAAAAAVKPKRPPSAELLRAGEVVDAAPLPDTERCAGDGGARADAEELAGTEGNNDDNDEDEDARGGAGDFVRGDGEGAENCAGRLDAGARAGEGDSEKADVGTGAGSVKDDADAV